MIKKAYCLRISIAALFLTNVVFSTGQREQDLESYVPYSFVCTDSSDDSDDDVSTSNYREVQINNYREIQANTRKHQRDESGAAYACVDLEAVTL